MRRLIVAILAATIILPCLVQAQIEMMSYDVPRWPVLVDPACPVSNTPSSPPNVSKELRVMYFPKAKQAKIKEPQSPVLQIAFNGPIFAGNHASIPFARKVDYWESVVPLDKSWTFYAILYVKDGDIVDDNGGKYWDVLFCTPAGSKDPNGVVAQAKTYNGDKWPLGIHRAKDLDKGIAILESAISLEEFSGGFDLSELLQMKVQREGGDAKAYAKVTAEVDATLDNKATDPNYLGAVENFVLFHPNDVPAEFAEHVASLVDKDHPKNSDCMRAMLAINRTNQERDPKRRLALIRQVIKDFPSAKPYDYREQSRLMAFIQMKDIAGAEASLATIQSSLPKADPMQTSSVSTGYQMVAELYLDSGVKYDRALALLDDASRSQAELVKRKIIFILPETQKQEEAWFALLRARAYLGLHQPDAAVQQGEIAVEANQKNAQVHDILAQAYAETGQKQKALDEYFNAALLPSNYDLKYQGELKRYYLKNFGSEKKYTAELNRRIAERFQATNYVPVLLNKPAPTLDFTTLKGEKFDAASLDGKTVILNFWSPG